MYIRWCIEDLCFCDIYIKGEVIYFYLETRRMWSSWNLTAKQMFCLDRQQDVYLGPVSWDPCALQFLLLEVLQYWLAHYLVFSTLPSLTWDKAVQLPWGLRVFPCLLSHFFWILPQIPKGASEKLTFFLKKSDSWGGRDEFFFFNKSSLWELLYFRSVFALKCLRFNVFRNQMLPSISMISK